MLVISGSNNDKMEEAIKKGRNIPSAQFNFKLGFSFSFIRLSTLNNY